MNEQFGDNQETGAVNVPQYTYSPEPQTDDNDPVMLRRKIQKGYGWASLSMILQYIFINVAVIICSVAYSAFKTTEFMAANPGATQKELMEFTTELSGNMMSNMLFLLVATVIGYLIGNIGSTLIAASTVRAFKVKEFFGKIKVSGSSVLLAALVILGLQALSMFAQALISNITGYTGVNEATSELLSFSDNMTTNILLVAYTVIIAPITEELLMRGFILNSLSPVNRNFGIIASSLLFGLMHGNFNQIFNGFLLGLLLAYIAMKSGSIKASIICHMAANFNAMFCGAFYEYYLLNERGEDAAYTAEVIHFAVLLVLGIIAAVLLLKRHGMVTQNDCIVENYSFTMDKAEEKRLTWQLLLSRPSFWIITAIYLFTAVTSITAISG
ncbi:MAG: CPBP family intramembrane metalloprotease [Oscillospiraceae bacterium]|nr:CPBP family intramembrane metalloprotease [Oscillospiraceae bacterium]